MIVIADTPCFILFEKISQLDLLKSLCGHAFTTAIIVKEFGAPLPDWVVARPVNNLRFQTSLDVDAVEASAISLVAFCIRV